MKDFRGTELYIGDKVVINSQTSTNGNHLTEGVITDIYKHGGYDIAKVKYKWHEALNYESEYGFSSSKIVKL